ncbi:Uncharacterised protein [Legionella busanensis]|uniref:Thaumarchaeal output domain-containing protein n=1 Tax=Legionella busanensis TaxID=190655 RepID=A0A378JSR8_9GAMM|nr:hypothetical protein [Legionella busanensis]STX52830.1 Uncharacterised protein [Legionella busanensis]
MSNKKIIILADENYSLDADFTPSHSVEYIQTLDDFSANECFLLALKVTQTTSWTLLQQLRKMPNAQLTPLFYIGEIDERLSSLYDGPLDEKALEIADRINELITQISAEYTHAITYLEQLILSYLFTRKDYLLTGFIDYHVPSGIEYPLVRFLNPNNEEKDSWAFLETMADDGLLQPQLIIGEVQLCPTCQSPALSGAELIRCTVCKSSILKVSLDPNNNKYCPYCQTKFESQAAASESFELKNELPFYRPSFAEKTITCLDCKRQLSQTELLTKKCFTYVITNEGKKFVKGISFKRTYLISDKAPIQSVTDTNKELTTVYSVQALPTRGCFSVILDLTSNWQDKLIALRKLSYYQLTPLFYLGEFITSPELMPLFDGPFDNNSILIANDINERIQRLYFNENNQFIGQYEWFILSYLFTRPKLRLLPQLNHQVTQAFTYPVLDLFGQPQKEDTWEYLQDLVTSGFLKQGAAHSEIQACPSCHAGLLNFTSNCPNCHSVDIQEQQFIHCFTCGHIGPISEFMLREQLRCSRCHTKLRHIGIDYDKPLEDKLCLNCKHSFFEYEVNVTCLVCKKQSMPQDLLTRKLYEYNLDRYGINIITGVRQNLFKELPQIFKFLEFNAFMAIVKWNIKMAKRFNNLSFSLLAINILNTDDLMLELGLLKMEKLLREFFEGLRTVFREIDLCTKNENQLIFFLPMTDEHASSFIIKKIRDFTEKNWRRQEAKIDISLSYVSSHEIIKLNLNENSLLAELHGWKTYEQ